MSTPIPQIAPADALRQAQALRAAGAAPVLLDVREPWEVAVAAVNADAFAHVRVPMQQIPGALDQLPKDQAIFVMCHHGMRSQHVAMFLAAQGFGDLHNMAGGIDAWSRSVDPTVPCY